jgi:hypothetical protein
MPARRRTMFLGGEAGLKVGLIAVIAAVAGLAAGAALWAGSDHDGDGPAATGAGDLYVVDGRLVSARWTGADTLEVGVKAATVLWFSDRPTRLNGNRPIGQFVAQWPSTFGADPPNAAVLAPSDEELRRPIAVELQRPNFDRSTGIVRFALRLERGSDDREAGRIATLDRARRSELGRLVLFVDDGPTPPTPAEIIAANYARAADSIEVLRAQVADAGEAGAEAAQDLSGLAALAGG